MRHVIKEVVAVPFTGPKVEAMLLAFFRILRIEVLAKSQDHHLACFKLKILAGQKHLVPGNESQDALVIFRQRDVDVHPLYIHAPVN